MKRTLTIAWLTLMGVVAAITLAAGNPALADSKSQGTKPQAAPATPVACNVVTGKVVDSPNSSTSPVVSSLNGVAVIAADDVWAVGTFRNPSGTDRTLIEHWDGTQWLITTSPNLGAATGGNYLLEVSGTATNDVWAVGWAVGVGAISMHWDGTQWTSVTVPNLGSVSSNLQGIKAIAPNDVWAVGSFGHAGLEQTVAIHWNGTAWIVTSSVVLGSMSAFYDVDVVSPNDVWAVGKWRTSSASPDQTLTAHWNGLLWSVVSSPNADSSVPNYLYGVTALSANDIWAVGTYNVDSPMTLAYHYNGSAWSIVNSSASGVLNEVVALSASDVYAVGSNYDQNTGVISPVSGHWNGSSWSAGTAPSIGPERSILFGITKGASGDLWSVGKGYSSGSSVEEAYTAHRAANQWNIVPDQTDGSTMNNLRGIYAVNSDDIWAVGTTGASAHTLIEHWNGTAWSIVLSPNAEPPNSVTSHLQAVSGSGASSAWAVGYSQAGDSPEQSLIMRWDGSTWSIVTSLNVGTGANYLYGVSAYAANDVWAVGYSSTNQPLVLHYNGTTWSVVATPTLGADARLMGVKALAANDVWAVGGYTVGSSAERTLVLHYNGTDWTQVNSPDLGGTASVLNAVSAVATNDAWAVGYSGTAANSNPLAVHWNGTEWTQVSTGLSTGGNLYGLDAVQPNSVWAVGTLNIGPGQTLVMRWDGTSWSVIGNPNSSLEWNSLYAVAAAATNDVWAVGQYASSGTTLTLAEQFGPASFTDVADDNTFFPYVQCMVCRGIVNGYSDGTFRPNNNVTRGQLAKIISNSAGFADDAGPQLFEDIAPGSTFYEWVNRLASRGDIGGYACGGEGEPCGNGNLPYFRPNSNATRGQITKIVSNAAGFSDTPGGQTFEDVPASNPFYLWVERLASRGIMGGYACGGEGEPCGPDNLPYFRLGNNATRGQSSKVVANAFFPDCQTR